jgi:hypothetical protein
LALVVGLAVLISRRAVIRRTTLGSAWWWAVLALAAWCGVELAAARAGTIAEAAQWSPLRMGAVALSFCPVIALIGAKRPQHKAWNLVVFSLWAIVALPAVEAVLVHRSTRVEMGATRSWFLWIMVALTPINLLPTRYWLAALSVATSQIVALSPYLALIHRPLSPEPSWVGLQIGALALVSGWLTSRRATAAANPFDRLWLDFRDTMGLLWALRVQERLDSAAAQYGWDFEITWNGFRTRTGNAPLDAIDPAIEPSLRTTFSGLLRRFVAHEWIAERLEHRSPQIAHDE